MDTKATRPANGFWTRLRDRAATFKRRLAWALRACHDEAPSLWVTLLPWPVRFLVVLGGWIAAYVWHDSAPAAQIGWTLTYGGAIAVSLAVSFWFIVAVVDTALALVWLVVTHRRTPPSPKDHPLLWQASQLVELANRQASHIQAFWIWMALAMSSTPRITVQIPALLALVLLAPGLIDTVTRLVYPHAGRASGELQSARRPLIYAATLLGHLVLTCRTLDGQILNVLPLTVALSLGTLLRVRRHVVRNQRAQTHPLEVQAFRRRQRQLTRGADVALGPIFTVASVIGLAALSMFGRDRLDHEVATALDGKPAPEDTCQREPGGPGPAAVSLFVMADSQLHELGGARFPGQTELADALVPSAVRPVELDMLSSVPLAHFRDAYEELTLTHGENDGKLYWAHLGDLADMGCRDEMERAFVGLVGFPRDRLAGIAPGNHDMSFTGNFDWSPFWGSACWSGRLDKAASLAKLESFLGDGRLWPGRTVAPVRGSDALVTVAPLGLVSHRGKARGLVAIFIDTADRAAFGWGIAGLFGTFSSAQAERLRDLVQGLPGAAGLSYADPIFLVFGHHTLGDMTGPSAGRLVEFLAWLDDDPLGTDPSPARTHFDRDPRVLALITAHTHHAESHRHCVGLRGFREIVVGSTIDPPEQAALIEVGTDARGRASVRVRTVPAIERPDFTCGVMPATIDAALCRDTMARLKNEPACARLFDSYEAAYEAEDEAGPKACPALEQPLTLWGKLTRLARQPIAFEPEDIHGDQQARARRLLACVCRRGTSAACAEIQSADPFKKEAFTKIIDAELASGDRQARSELVCLAWAASAVQEHKAGGMTYAQGLRCAFDDPSIPAAKDLVVSLEAGSCQ